MGGLIDDAEKVDSKDRIEGKRRGRGGLSQQPCLRRSIYGHHSGAAGSSFIGRDEGDEDSKH